MRHDRPPAIPDGSILARNRVQLAGALLIGALLPWALRGPLLPGTSLGPASLNALTANTVAIVLAFWTRLSMQTYPGIQRSHILLPSALTGHGIILVWFVLTRFPYDRIGLLLGFFLHVVWLYAVNFGAERRVRRRIAIVPFGAIDRLRAIDTVDWLLMSRPRLNDTRGCDAIVADFGAELPDEWEGFLAQAALAGWVVYQVKELWESLTGRVELEHLSENSFGSLLPMRSYFHLKTVTDFIGAVLALPFVGSVMAGAAAAILIEDGGPVLFKQQRIGHAAKRIMIYKFRTMRKVSVEDERRDASAGTEGSLTRVGKILRKFRLDELPQVINILKGQMSWIGPRPEPDILSVGNAADIPFYRYRYVLKPGISGWAQVNQPGIAKVGESGRELQYDFYYIKYFSPWLDILIFVRTLKMVLTGWAAR